MFSKPVKHGLVGRLGEFEWEWSRSPVVGWSLWFAPTSLAAVEEEEVEGEGEVVILFTSKLLRVEVKVEVRVEVSSPLSLLLVSNVLLEYPLVEDEDDMERMRWAGRASAGVATSASTLFVDPMIRSEGGEAADPVGMRLSVNTVCVSFDKPASMSFQLEPAKSSALDTPLVSSMAFKVETTFSSSSWVAAKSDKSLVDFGPSSLGPGVEC